MVWAKRKKHLFKKKWTKFCLLKNSISSQGLFISFISRLSVQDYMQPGQSCASVNIWGTSYFRVYVNQKKSLKMVAPACLKYSQAIHNTASIVTCQAGDWNEGRKKVNAFNVRRTNTGRMLSQAKKHKKFASYQVVSLLVLECYLDWDVGVSLEKTKESFGCSQEVKDLPRLVLSHRWALTHLVKPALRCTNTEKLMRPYPDTKRVPEHFPTALGSFC